LRVDLGLLCRVKIRVPTDRHVAQGSYTEMHAHAAAPHAAAGAVGGRVAHRRRSAPARPCPRAAVLARAAGPDTSSPSEAASRRAFLAGFASLATGAQSLGLSARAREPPVTPDSNTSSYIQGRAQRPLHAFHCELNCQRTCL